MSGSRVMRGGCRRHLADRQGGGGVALRRRRDDNFRRVQPEFFGFFRVFRDRFFAFRANKRGQQRVNGVRVRERGDGLLKFPHILPLFQHDFFRRPFQADGGNVFFLELKKLFLRGFGGLFLFRHLDFKDVIISAEQKQRDKKYQCFFEAHSDFLPQIAQISQMNVKQAFLPVHGTDKNVCPTVINEKCQFSSVKSAQSVVYIRPLAKVHSVRPEPVEGRMNTSYTRPSTGSGRT